MSTRLEPGTKAPSFTLEDYTGQQYSLADYAGHKVILYFYPKASTPGCTKEACDFRDNLASLKSLGYVVLGVSPDKPAALEKFTAKSLSLSPFSPMPITLSHSPTVHGAKRKTTAKSTKDLSAPHSSSMSRAS